MPVFLLRPDPVIAPVLLDELVPDAVPVPVPGQVFVLMASASVCAFAYALAYAHVRTCAWGCARICATLGYAQATGIARPVRVFTRFYLYLRLRERNANLHILDRSCPDCHSLPGWTNEALFLRFTSVCCMFYGVDLSEDDLLGVWISRRRI